jgi:hypothetical protein
MTWDELAGVTDPKTFNLFTVPDRVADGDPWAGIDDTAHSSSRCWTLRGAARRGRAELPAGLPEDARRAAARAAEQEGRRPLGRGRQPDHPETRNRLAQAAYRFGVRSWMSGRFTWASAIGLVVVLIGVVAAFLLFPPADRTSGLDGGVEAVLASVSGIGVFVVLAIVWGWYGVFLPRRERCEHDARMVEASAPRDPAVAARAAELHSKIDDLRRRETLAATSAERKLLHAQRIDLERVYLGMSQSQAD